MVRIYALQHMRPWYRMQGQKDPRIKEAFFSALEESLTRNLPELASTLSGKTGDGSHYVPYASSGNAMPIRLASIAAIGNSGDRTQLEFLSQIALKMLLYSNFSPGLAAHYGFYTVPWSCPYTSSGYSRTR